MIETNLNIFVLLGAAIIDSINPCAIGVLVFLLAYLTQAVKKPRAILTHGLVYLSAVFLTYLLAGLILLPLIQEMRNFSVNAYLAIAAVVAFFGILEMKEYFAPGASSLVEIPPRYSKMIAKYKDKMLNSHFFTFLMGVFVAMVELPCTGAVYLAVLSLMSIGGVNISNVTLLVIYNLIFIGPLIVILILFYRGMESAKIQTWVNKHKRKMRLMTGILLLGLAAWMVGFVL